MIRCGLLVQTHLHCNSGDLLKALPFWMWMLVIFFFSSYSLKLLTRPGSDKFNMLGHQKNFTQSLLTHLKHSLFQFIYYFRFGTRPLKWWKIRAQKRRSVIFHFIPVLMESWRMFLSLGHISGASQPKQCEGWDAPTSRASSDGEVCRVPCRHFHRGKKVNHKVKTPNLHVHFVPSGEETKACGE